MLPLPDARPLTRTPPRGPEPLRRKRAPAAVSAGASSGRRILNGLLVFATAVLLIDAFVGEKGLLEGLRARASYAEAEASLNRLRAENRDLRETVRLYRDDPAAQESLVRESLGYIRPGEVLFIVRDAPRPRQ